MTTIHRSPVRLLLALATSMLICLTLLPSPSVAITKPESQPGGYFKAGPQIKPIYKGGNPYEGAVKGCRTVLTGPNREAGSNKILASARLECFSQRYLLGQIRVEVHKWNDDARRLKSLGVVQSSNVKTFCKGNGDSQYPVTARSVDGIKWYGCTVSVSMADNDKKNTYWTATVVLGDVRAVGKSLTPGASGPDSEASGGGEVVNVHCKHTYRTWCNQNPDKVAQQWNWL